ncbi:MAG: 16S rRNA (guanine(527)-N(7))-methyltransferase RsmG [Defluviitaleaceae bacterium]|nr:16S rRNA (guanine(527)-N(7))-methyltransferase RsmG [Defluviitaleaceae bacterium]
MREDIIREWAEQNGITLTATQLENLEAHQQRVLTVNQQMNLTAITGPADFAVKHIIDSMTLLPYIKEGASLIDIGTGAGFPGLVLCILREDLRVTLLDSRNKRVEFLRQTVEELKLSGVDCIHARAEEWARATSTRYDICTARAVAPMDKLAKYALPLIKPGGLFLAMKGPDVSDELEKAKPALEKKGGTIEKVDTVEIADSLHRSIVVVLKNAVPCLGSLAETRYFSGVCKISEKNKIQ